MVSKREDIEKDIQRIISSANVVSSSSEFFRLRCELFNIFDKVNEDVIKDIVANKDYHNEILESVFSNKCFKNTFWEVLESDRDLSKSMIAKSKEENKQKRRLSAEEWRKRKRDHWQVIKNNKIEQKKLLCSGMLLSFFILAVVYKFLPEEKIRLIKKYFNNLLFSIRQGEEDGYAETVISFKLHEILKQKSYSYNEKLDFQFRANQMFEMSIVGRCLGELMLVVINQNLLLKNKFKETNRFMTEEWEKFSITKALTEINGVIYMVNKNIEYAREECSIIKKDSIDFDNFINNFSEINERNVYYFLSLITTGFQFEESKDLSSILDVKIKNVSEMKRKAVRFAESNLQAFSSDSEYENKEWSNKIYLVSFKTLSALEAIEGAKNKAWKIKVFVHEFSVWIKEINEILNKMELEDDFENIKKFLRQENNKVEWKSTFYTSTEEKYLDETFEKDKQKKIFSLVVDVILGMINTEGGTVLVGVVENPDRIVREGIRENIIEKGGCYFFDIGYELGEKGKNLDVVKREIQDKLFSWTLKTPVEFNNLWNIEPLEIKSAGRVINIYKIDIKKSEHYIYNVGKVEGINSIYLTKRANGRTEKVDPRDYFENGKIKNIY